MSRLLQARRLSRMGDAATGYEKQEEAAARYAAVHDHEIVATADDTNVSGSKDPFERPQLGPWLTKAEMVSQYDGIIAAKLDRLGRNARHLTELRNWAEDHGKSLFVVEPTLQWPPAPGDMAQPIIWDVLSRLAEYELAAITERNHGTQEWLRRNGYLVGKATFGYRIAPHPDDPKHKTLEPDEDYAAPYVRKMVERAIAGASMQAIAEWLNEEGVTSPQGGTWGYTTVAQVLRNPILTGRRKSSRSKKTGIAKGETVLRVPPIVDAATFARLQAAIAPSRRGKVSNEPALLAGILFCAKCRGRMTRKRSPRKKVVHEAYRCDGPWNGKSECGNFIRRQDIDPWVEREFIGHFGDREVVRRVVIPGAGHDAEVELVEADLRALDFDDPRFQERQAELLAERARLRALPDDPDQVQEVGTGRTVAETWEAMDTTAERRDYLLSAGVKVYAAKDPDGFLEIDLEAETPHVLWQS